MGPAELRIEGMATFGKNESILSVQTDDFCFISDCPPEPNQLNQLPSPKGACVPKSQTAQSISQSDLKSQRGIYIYIQLYRFFLVVGKRSGFIHIIMIRSL